MINWSAFPIVVATALISACLLVSLFAAALRVGDGTAPWRRPTSIALYALCGLLVAFGIYLIVPALHAFG